MARTSIQESIAQVDSLTKQGRRSLALPLLEKILTSKPPTELLPALARLANRNSAYVLALRILYSEIQMDREKIKPASPEAFAVYASSLLNIGALEEAKECAETAGQLNETRLIRAFIYFAEWNYEKAIPHLRDYIHSKETTSYQVLVGQVNLAASLISLGRFVVARKLLNDLIENLKQDPNGQLLLGNSFELFAQIEIQDGQVSEGRNMLEQARQVLQTFPGRYLLYVNKWNAILRLTERATEIEPLLLVKADAVKLRNWETLRDCDFHRARLTEDQALMAKVYFGTPYAGFRNRLTKVFAVEPPKTSAIQFVPQNISGKPSRIVWDLEDRNLLGNAGATGLALVQAMTRDVYRPPRMGLIFSALYPEERFNPLTSIQRIRNSVFRFNEWSAAQGEGFQIHIEKGDFFFRSKEPHLGISFRPRRRSQRGWQIDLQHFRKSFGPRSFSSSDLARFLGVTQRTATSILKLGLEKKKIRKIGMGSSSSYMFSGRNQKKES